MQIILGPTTSLNQVLIVEVPQFNNGLLIVWRLT